MATVVVESIDLLPDGRIDLTATVMAGGAARELSDPVIRLAPRATPDEVLVAASVVEASQGRWAVGCSILAEVLARLDEGPDLVDVHLRCSVDGRPFAGRLQWAGAGERWLPQPTPSRMLSLAKVAG